MSQKKRSKKRNDLKHASLTAALAYAVRGWPVMPLHGIRNGRCTCGKTKCTSPGKHPRTKNGLKDATTDATQIRKWWRRWPDANVGIATGGKAGLVVLDVDPRHGGTESLAAVVKKHGPLPKTVTSNTGGDGLHYFFAHPGGEVKSSSKGLGLGDGLDIKADGGYVVAPPSRHVSGGGYSWAVAPEDAELAPLPKWMCPPKRTKKAKKAANDEVIHKGERNTALASIAGYHRGLGASEKKIRERLLAINAKQCQPPLSEEEVGKIAASISQYEPDPTKVKIATRLLGLLGPDVELFHSPKKEAMIRFAVDGHYENWPVASDEVKEWLRHGYYVKFGEAVGDLQLADAVQTMKAKAKYDGPKHPVAVRLAKCADGILLDLGDAEWRVVKITAAGWEVVSDPPVRFRRTPGMLPLPLPSQDGDVNLLRPLINVPDDSAWALILGWLAGALRPDGPHPLLAVNGEPGSAKSTLCRILQKTVDPHEAGLRSLPSSVEDLGIACQNGAVLAYDNLSFISNQMSDALCKVATSASHATREHYTNDREHILLLSAAVLLNGVGEVVRRSDLLDRAIVLHLPPIHDGDRKTETALWQDFDAVHAQILGGLLDAVVIALGRKAEVTATARYLPRMADFFVWAVAAEPGLGLPNGAFKRAYAADQQDKQAMLLEDAPIAAPLQRLLIGRPTWTGTSQELLDAISGNQGESGTGYSTWHERQRPGWPRTARGVRSQLSRLRRTLLNVGIKVTFPDGKHGRDSKRLLTIEKLDAERSAASTASTAEPATTKRRSKKKRTKKRRKAGGAGGAGGRNRPTLGQGDGDDVTQL